MHEYSLLTDVLRKISLLASENPGMEVAEVNIRLGARCGISPESLKKEFKTFTRGTIVEHAMLSIQCANNQNDPWVEDILLEGLEFEEVRDHA